MIISQKMLEKLIIFVKKEINIEVNIVYIFVVNLFWSKIVPQCIKILNCL